ncbi:hypothetical protein QZM28_22835 [Burkholderia multivorans]|nr:hypothetical protein [Burkholderia multivorans]
MTFKGEPVTLSGAQLLEALDFIAPDRDTDQLESEVTIQYGEGHTGKGMYCWCTEYPDEGAIFLDGSTPATIGAPADAGEARLTDEQREAIKFAVTWFDKSVLPDTPYSGYSKALRELLNGADQS